MSKLSKLIKDPDLFFYDLFKKRIEKRNRNLILEDLNGVIPAFHIVHLEEINPRKIPVETEIGRIPCR